MKISCILGHKWNGCMCDRCGEKRDCEHTYTHFIASGFNECVGICKCGKKQILKHDWDGCICRRCGKKRNEGHNWVGEKCARCGFLWRDSYEYALLMMNEKNYSEAYKCFERLEKGPFRGSYSDKKRDCIQLAYEYISNFISHNDYTSFDYTKDVSNGLFQMEAHQTAFDKNRYPYTDKIKKQIVSVIIESIDKKDYRSVHGWLKSMSYHWSDLSQFIDSDKLNDGLYGAALECMNEKNYKDAMEWFQALPKEYPGVSQKMAECEECWQHDSRNPDFCQISPNGKHEWKIIPGSEKTIIDHVLNPKYYMERCIYCNKEETRSFVDYDEMREAYKYNN